MDITTLKKKYKDSFYEGGSYPKLNFTPTGFPNLDYIIGGGIPEGRVVELFGENGSGKTTLAMQFASRYTDKGEKVLFVDLERTYSERFDHKLIDVCEPDSGEDAVDRVVEAINSGYKFIIFDSVAAAVPMAELDTSADQMQIGKHARLMNRMMRMVPSLLRNTGTTLLLINQFRQKVGAYGNPNETTGGKGIDYACSLRMEIAPMPKKDVILNDEGEVELKPAKIKIVKTKMRWGTSEAILYLGPDGKYSELMDTLITSLQYELIFKKGAFIKYGDITLGQGMIRSALYLKDNPDMIETLKKQLKDRLDIKVVSSGMMFSQQESKDVANKLITSYNKKWGTSLELY